MGDDNGILVAAVAIGGGLLLWKLLSDKGEEAPAATASPALPMDMDPAAPQERPGAADAGGGFDVYAFPPGTTPKDIANWFAANGNAHDAGAYLNDTQNPPPQPTPDAPPTPAPINVGGRLVDYDVRAPPAGPPAPVPTATTPAVPANDGKPISPETHEDILGRTQPGPPSEPEAVSKAALPLAGGLAAVDVGVIAARLAPAAVTASRPLAEIPQAIRGMAGTGALGGAVAAGVGAGVAATQVLQETGFFDKVVKPAGEATAEKIGPQAAKTTATVALPLSVPGAIIKAAVTPGESVLGNINRAAEQSFIPETVNAGRKALDDVRGVLAPRVDQARAAVSSRVEQAKAAVSQTPNFTSSIQSAATSAAHSAKQKAGEATAAVQQKAGEAGANIQKAAASFSGFLSRKWF